MKRKTLDERARDYVASMTAAHCTRDVSIHVARLFMRVGYKAGARAERRRMRK